MSTLTDSADFGSRYARAMDEATAMHAPMFDAVEQAIGLRPVIWQSGGMTMTIYLALPEQKADGQVPGYLGLVEGINDNGEWEGSLSFYTDVDDYEESAVDLVTAYSHDSAASYRTHPTLSAEGFAQALIEHYRSITV